MKISNGMVSRANTRNLKYRILTMSYINEALKKAQKEKDALYAKENNRLHSATRKGKLFFSRRWLWMMSLFFALILLAFTSYSWLDSRETETVLSSKDLEPKNESRQRVPIDTKYYYDRAKAFHKSGSLKEARKLYERVLVREPRNVSALNNLGVTYMQEGRYQEAQKRLENAVQLDPEYVDPYYNLACLYAIKGDSQKSLHYLNRAVSLDESVREWARKDRDLQSLKGMTMFEKVIGNKDR